MQACFRPQARGSSSEDLTANWEVLVRCQVRANVTNLKAKRQFSDRNRAVHMNVQSPHKWWSTLKGAVFGTSSSLPPLVNEGSGLVCESVGKADLPSNHFDSKQSREAVSADHLPSIS